MESCDLFVPGRVCLFGEHSDWAAGYRAVNSSLEKGFAIITGTDQGLYARASRHPDKLVFQAPRLDDRPRETYAIPMQPAALEAEARAGGFISYVAGTACQILRHHDVGGLSVDNHRMDLPIQRGLSSSAAACVLTTRAFNHLYGLGLSVREEMELAYLGERTTPSCCGRLDQACAYGRQAVFMVFDGDELDVQPIPMPRPVHLVVVDLCAGKDTRRILDALNACYPDGADASSCAVQQYLGPINARLVEDARRALQEGDSARVGKLMTEAQAAFDTNVAPACEQELRAPALHDLLAHAPLRDLTLGGKGVGSQGDGAAQFVVPDQAAQQKVIALVRAELGLSGLALTIPETDETRSQ